MKARRKGVTQAQGRRRLAFAGALVFCLVAFGAFMWVRSSDLFAVRSVSVPVLERVSDGDLRRAVNEAAGVNLLRVSTDRIEARLRAIPYVRTAQVYRRFPDSLEVDIAEYVPVAQLEDKDGGRWLLAADGRVLSEWDPQGEPGLEVLPLFKTEAEVWPESGVVTVPQIVEALPLAPRLTDPALWPLPDHPVDHVLVTAAGDTTMILSGGGEVRLGWPSQLDDKLMVALEVVERYLNEGKRLEYVDVRTPASAVAKAK